MTSSEGRGGRSEGLNTLLEHLGRDGLYANLDGPIDRVAAAYRVPKQAVDSTDELLQIATEFLRHVEKEFYGRTVSGGGSDKLPEALHLIGRYYRSASGIGLDAALRDAAAPGGSVTSFLTVFVEAVRAEHRGLRIQAAMARYVDPLDWAGRVAATEEVLALMAAGFEGTGGPCLAARFAPDLKAILLAYIEGEGQLAGILGDHGSEPATAPAPENSKAAQPL